MKILIPFSGGINSTYSLWRYLAETDHEIHVYRFTESFEIQDRKRTAALAMVDWLKTNVRDFTFWEETGTLPEHAEQLEPVRIGFERTFNAGVLIPRWEKQAAMLDSVEPDAVVRGSSLEGFAFDVYPVTLADIRDRLFNRDVLTFVAGHPTLETAINFMAPTDPAEWVEQVWRPLGEIITGRFEQLEALPTALQDLREKECDEYHAPVIGNYCRECLYDDLIERRTDLTGREKDREIARLGQYDSGYANADRTEYHPLPAIAYALVEINAY